MQLGWANTSDQGYHTSSEMRRINLNTKTMAAKFRFVDFLYLFLSKRVSSIFVRLVGFHSKKIIVWWDESIAMRIRARGIIVQQLFGCVSRQHRGTHNEWKVTHIPSWYIPQFRCSVSSWEDAASQTHPIHQRHSSRYTNRGYHELGQRKPGVSKIRKHRSGSTRAGVSNNVR